MYIVIGTMESVADTTPADTTPIVTNDKTDKAFMLNNNINELTGHNNNIPEHGPNGWDRQTTITIEGWKRDLELMAYVYTVSKEKFILYIQRILITTLVITAFAAALSAINITLGGSLIGTSNDYKTVILALNVIICVGTATITVLNGLIKVYSWDTNSVSYNDFTGKVGALWTTIDSELYMPAIQRTPAAEFMKRVYGQYIMIKQLAPGIGSGDVAAARTQYMNATFDNFVWENQFAQKFREDIV